MDSINQMIQDQEAESPGINQDMVSMAQEVTADPAECAALIPTGVTYISKIVQNPDAIAARDFTNESTDATLSVAVSSDPQLLNHPRDVSVCESITRTHAGGSTSYTAAPMELRVDGADSVTAAEVAGLPVVTEDGFRVGSTRTELRAADAWALTDAEDPETASELGLGGREVLDAALALGNVAQCGEALGAMGAALTLTVEYLKTRKQFGVPIMRFQTLTQRAADMYVGVELTRSAVLYAAMALADPGEGDDALDLDAIVSRTKNLVGTYGRLVGQEAIQLHGGIGMTAEYAVGHYTSRLATIERTFGDTRQHLAALAAGVGDHTSVDVV